MPSSPAALRESNRLAALKRLQILDTLPEQAYDDLVALASEVCKTPIALVSLIDGDRQWFKAKLGLEAQQTPRSVAFCAHAIEDPKEVFTIADASLDPRFADNPLVTGGPRIRFYAGAPIITRGGDALGTVCVIDTKPGFLTDSQKRCLESLARHASLLFEMRENAIDAARAEVALLDQNEALEQFVEARTQERDHLWEVSEDFLVTATFDGRLVRVSPSWTRHLGYTEDELKSKAFAEYVHPDDVALVAAALERMQSEKRSISFEDRVIRKDGGVRWVAWTLGPEPGNLRLTGVGRDITEQKTAQAALIETEASLRQAQKMEAVGQLTGGLAHDFNNLLTGISGSLELLQIRVAQKRFDGLDRYINSARGASKRAAALTHRLLAFARQQTLAAAPTDVNRLLGDMVELIQRTIGPEIALNVVSAINLWPTMIDGNQLENALLNLCINARDAMPEGGELTIETSNEWLDEPHSIERDVEPGKYIRLSVSDTGTGMSAELVKKIFDPFFTTKPLGAGTGLGLSMVYGFARQSGGVVRVASTVGSGTTMSLYLPHATGRAVVEPVEPEAPRSADSQRHEVVLIVDDEPTVRMLLVEILQDLGYRVLEAHDGPAALKILQSDEQVDLLVTDVGLPGGLNGRQVADAARRIKTKLKVLFITGYAESAVIGHDHLDDGMQVITKPFAIETIQRRVADILLAGRTPAP